MTLTKLHLIDAIAEQNGFTKKKSSKTVETILEIIKSNLSSGEDMILPPRRVVTFKCSGKLRVKVN
jgi:integration host factor subunit alpha